MTTFIAPSKNLYSIVVDERRRVDRDARLGQVNAVGVAGALTLNINVNVSSKQRHLASESPSNAGLKRIALLADSMLARGSLTAYGWLVGAKLRLKAYRPTEGEAALAWLAEQVRFDLTRARAALAEVNMRSRL